jgi:hypothetical protein
VAQQAAPGNIQRQIEALTYDQGASPYVWSGWNPNPHGTSGMTNYPHKVFPNVPTSPMGGAGPLGYEGSAQQQRNNQLVTLQGNQNFAKQAASGWVNPITY